MADKQLEIKESLALGTVAPDAAQPGKFRIRIIEGDRWGSSGYYPATVVRNDGPRVFASGTQMFLNHPGMQEEFDRPERSVSDLVGIISSTPEWNEETKSLEADATFFSAYAPMLREIAPHVGVSIRAYASSEYGEIGGQFGEIITGFIAAESVDVVTRAGAGGAIISTIESATSAFRASQPRGEQQKESAVATEDNAALLAAITGMTEALVAEAKARTDAAAQKKADEAAAKAAAEELEKVNPLDLAGALTESKLPKAYQARVVEAVKGGMSVEDAIKGAKDELVEVLKESAPVAPTFPGGGVRIGAPAGGFFATTEAKSRLDRALLGSSGKVN